MNGVPDISVVREAEARIRQHVHRTPVATSAALDALTGARVFMKCEQLQKGGAFKARGACNAVLSMTSGELAGGVATHSSGNHGAALALAARIAGVRACVVMPRSSALIKQAAVREYGAEIEFCETSQSSRESTLRTLVERTGASVVHPYDDWRVIAGQGTATLEFIEQVPELDVLLVPVGGGGLISGAAIVLRELRPSVRLIGVEPAGADDASRSLRAGRRLESDTADTVADGLKAALGERNFAIISTLVEDIVTVSDPSIVEAMRWTWERTKMLIEPSAATVIAALRERRAEAAGQRIGVILSGGNVDLDRLPWTQAED